MATTHAAPEPRIGQSNVRPTPGRRGPRRLAWLAGWSVVLAGLLATMISSPAQAHRNDESYLYLDVGTSSLSGTVQFPYGDLRTVFDMELSGTAEEQHAEVESRLDELQTYAFDTTSIGANGSEWPLTFDGYRLLFERDVSANGNGYVILPYEVALPVENVPQVLDVEFTPMLAEIAGRNNVVLVSNDWQRGVFDEEANELLVVDADQPSGSIDLGDPSQWKNFRASIDLGVDHIRTGPDHIFFVIVLLLPSVLILVMGAWRPAPSFGGSLLRVILVATMFTIAHSITFTLAGLDYLPLPPSKLTETLIAASIAAAALHNFKPILGHREWVIAFVFGLFHGMGFAGLVDDLEIDRTTQLVSLLGRNVGIEIGQLVVILITFPGLFLLRRTRYYMPLFYVASGGLVVLSSIWIVERVFEVDAGINKLVDEFLLWPRSLWLAVAFTIVAAAVREIERRRDALLSVGDPAAPTTQLASDETDAVDDADDDLDDELEPVPTG